MASADELRRAKRAVLREAVKRLEHHATLEHVNARALYEGKRVQAKTVEESMALTINDDVAVAFERAADVVQQLLQEQ